MTDEDFTSYIPRKNDKTIINIMPISFDGHISLLYFTEDGLGVTTENTGYIVYNQIPIWTQGII